MQVEQIGELQAEHLYELGNKHMWLPFTQMKDYEEDPLIIASGEGVRVKDIHGNEYLDAYSSTLVECPWSP